MSLRASHRIAEVTLRDLRFSSAEITEFLKVTAGHTASESAVANLQSELEGWAVGLRLVSLALRNVEDPEAFLRGLRGGLPHTQDYLLDEVLNAQPLAVREMLSRASILERFSGGLLDAICASEDPAGNAHLSGDALVDLLQRSNLFAIPLDTDRKWFRFHHLFGDLLQRELKRESNADEINALHLRACDWLESHGLIAESIRHALAAGDNERAFDLVDQHRKHAINTDRWHVVESWLRLLPATVGLREPGVPLAQAWVAYWRFDNEKLGPLVERAASLINEKTEDPALLGELDFLQGHLAYWGGDATTAIRLLERAESHLVGAGPIIEGRVQVLLGLARCQSGHCEMAAEALDDRIRRLDPAETILLTQLLGALVFVRLTSGHPIASRGPAARLHAISMEAQMNNTIAWAAYFRGYEHFQSLHLGRAAARFAEAVRSPFILEGPAVVDSFAGLAISQQLAGDQESAEHTMGRFTSYAREQGAAHSMSVAQSCRARLAVL
ncbi:MAG: hypothetical protein WBP49_09055, partial [Acidimicrobiia bacterium]